MNGLAFSTQGGCQVFEQGFAIMVCALGTFSDQQQRTSRVFSLSANVLAYRNVIHTFDATHEIIGPPAYNQLTRCVLYL